MQKEPDCFSYSIPHMTIRLPKANDGSRLIFSLGNKTLSVEAAAKEYLRSLGWWVCPGDDGSFFFSALSANFRESFFADVCKNYVGPTAPELIAKLNELCVNALSTGSVSGIHINAACDFLCKYYHGASDHRKMQKIAEFCTTLPTESLIGLIRMHRSLGYITKGIPDLFAARPKEFLFVEVKSEGDALRAEQYVFFEALAREAPSGFLVLRVLGLTEGGRDLLRNPNDPQDMGGTIVEPENR